MIPRRLRDALLEEFLPDLRRLVAEEVAKAMARKRRERTVYSLTAGARYKKVRTADLSAALRGKRLDAEFKANGGVGIWRISKAALDRWSP